MLICLISFLNLHFLLFQKSEEGSISQRVQRLAKYRFLKVSFLFFLPVLLIVVCLSAKSLFHAFFLMKLFLLFLQKQSDLLLNTDDPDAMWVCLRENCVIDDATGAEKISSIYYYHLNMLPHFLCIS